MSKILVDSNTLIYLVDSGEKTKNKKALEWLRSLPKDNNSYFVALQNLREFSAICIKKTSLNKEKITEWVNLYSKLFTVLDEKEQDIMNAVRISREHKTPFWDALIIATMQRNGIGEILTENMKDFKMEGIIPKTLFQAK